MSDSVTKTYKKMRIAIAFFASMLFGASAFAQKHTVKGAVLDSLSREPEPAAVVQFFKAADKAKPIAYAVAGEDGKFSHVLSGDGEYTLMFSNVGRKTVWKDFTLEKGVETLDIGEILACDDAQALSDAVVTAQRPLVKMDVDKMTYDVANDVDSKVTTVLDMLRKVPMVAVDGQDNITVNGSSSFLVTIDGKPNPMLSANASTAFKMMPAAAIKEIEVITNPGVKYDAEGVGGVLNLVTNKEITGGASATDGYYATIRAQAGNRNQSGGLFLSLQKGKFAMSINGDLGQTKQKQYVDNLLSYENGSSMLQSTKTTNKIKFGMASLNLSYELDSLNLFTATAGWMGFPNKQNGTEENGSFNGELQTGKYISDISMKRKYHSFNVSADYQHSWAGKPGQTFTFSYQYAGTPTSNDDKRLLTSASGIYENTDSRRVKSKANAADHTFQADFTLPIAEGHKLSTGLKYVTRHNYSTDDYYIYENTFVPAPDLGSEYDYFNRIGAIYGEYSGTVGKWGLKAGARYEHTWQKIEYATDNGNNFKTNYGDLVPTASVQYNFLPFANIGLSYNMRLSRPGITYLNPYVNKSNPTFWTKGNSDLDVAKAHSFNLVMNLYTPKIMVSLTGNLTHTGNGIEQYNYVEDGVIITTYGNIVKSTKTGVSAFINYNASSKTRIYANMGLDYNDLRSTKLGQSNSGWSGHVFGGAQETIFWDLRLSENIMYNGRHHSLQGYMDGFSGVALSITKNFLNDKLSFSLNAFSPLNSDGSIRIKMFSRNPGREGVSAPFKNTTSVKVPIRQFTFGVSWTFGGNTSAKVKKASRSIQKDDIVGGASSSSGAASDATQVIGM